jgi:hypothetical protein
VPSSPSTGAAQSPRFGSANSVTVCAVLFAEPRSPTEGPDRLAIRELIEVPIMFSSLRYLMTVASMSFLRSWLRFLGRSPHWLRLPLRGDT